MINSIISNPATIAIYPTVSYTSLYAAIEAIGSSTPPPLPVAVAAATGEQRYAAAGAEGLPWCFGENELGFQFYDANARFAHRAIKRGGWADRAELWANTLAGVAGLRRRLTLGSPVVNTTCRPYHLGWIMEAWAGREANVELLGRSR